MSQYCRLWVAQTRTVHVAGHYNHDGVINNNGDIGEQLQVSDAGKFEDQYGSNAQILRDESLDEGNNVIYGLIHVISRIWFVTS